MTHEFHDADPDDVFRVAMAFAKSTTMLESIKFKLRKLDWVEDRMDKALHIIAGQGDRMTEFRLCVDARFDAVDKRFDAVDKRFDAFQADVDKRFDAVDKRFDAMDQRFDAMDQRFGTIEVLLRELAGKPA